MRANSLSDLLCRLCIPSTFPVKSIAFHALSSRLEQWPTAEKDVTYSSALELRRLLKIVDEILGAESYPEDIQLPSFEEQPAADLTCASCGGEIFRTAFCCNNACTRDGKTGASFKNKLAICALCFVEGRICNCQDMQPFYTQEMDSFVGIRETAHAFLSDNAERLLLEEEDETGPDDASAR